VKQQEIIVLGLAGVAVYLIWKSTKPGAGKPSSPVDYVNEIMDSAGKAFNNGWRYFANGVAIDPSGNYYREGQMIWQAPGAGT
jgi:hypothetical protein